MDILLWVIFGGIAGAIASSLMGAGGGLLSDIVMGIIGAVVGGFIMNFFGKTGVTGFNLYSLVVAIIGAVVVILIGRKINT